jgi:excisionase family DNA binding protein
MVEPWPNILTLDEVAADLRVPRRTVMDMAQRRELPMFKIRRTWRIHSDTYEEWKRAREAALMIPRTPPRRPRRAD